jgi:hypothetical protein
LPAQQRSSNGDVIGRDSEQLRKDPLTSAIFRRGHDGGDVTIATHWVTPPFDGDMGAMQARLCGRLEFDIHEPTTRKRSSVESFVDCHLRHR